MIRHIWSVLCSRTVIDQGTNQLSMFDILEEVQAETRKEIDFPVTVPFQVVLVSYWVRQDDKKPVKGEYRVRVIDPDGAKLGEFTGKINLKASGRSRTLTTFNALSFGGPGRHGWEVAYRVGKGKWKDVTSIPVDFTVTVSA